ncbi:MAG: ATP-binding protein [Deltaproteobacteria bacterium]|nr:MAG: ATP-binding protein [Deltaproteobacteria bacterium]
MNQLQEINWNNFKAKFNGKEQSSFEWLCYLLFCKEFNKPLGIFRYKNQAGIETNPIESNGHVIGWQAKFYDTRLSEHKEDFIASINTAKNRHPEISKIIFYTNQAFGQDKKKTDPKYKKEIGTYAKSKNVIIEWRAASFFESPFVCEENINIAQHFFSLEKSVIDFIGELTLHTESILKPIHSKIYFDSNEIKIDRSQVMDNLKKTLHTSSLVILSGEAGVGKTAVIKDFYDLEKETKPFFVFKATEFNLSNINQLFKDHGVFTLTNFIKEYEDIGDKLIVIDSAEKLSEIGHHEVVQEFISALLDSSWRIIFTTRHSYLDDLKYQFIEVYKLNFKLLNIENLTNKELIDFSDRYNFNLPDSERLHELLHNPFYLNEYLQIYKNLGSTISYADFKNILWNKRISNKSFQKNNTHIKRENCFIKIAQERANDGHFFVKADDCEDEILQKLELDEIIKYDSNAGGYFITHDIYEEWALERSIERAFHKSEDYENFYTDIGCSLPIRRAFRNWLSEKLLVKNEDIKTLIEATISNAGIESYWKDEIIVSVLLSDYSEKFFQIFENKLLEDEQELLLKTVFLLRIACKEIDENFLNFVGISKTEGIALRTFIPRPKGKGWDCVIDFINKHKKKLGLKHMNTILPLLGDWNNKNKQGETTKNASQIALFYYDEITKNGGFGYRSRDETKNLMISTILNGSFEIKEELTKIFNYVVLNKDTDDGSKFYELIHTILSSALDSFDIAKNFPEHVIRLADLFWFQIPDETDWRSGAGIEVEQYFCITPENHLDYHPASALQTPIFQLLRFAPKQTIDFILTFTNKTVECYSKSNIKNEVEEVEVFIDETKSIKQYISNRLWNMYRGTQVSTYLLESIHMALEKWMLEYAKSVSKENLASCCKYLIENSKSASITAVVTSVVLAQPSGLFDIAKLLFRTKEFILNDTSRMAIDQTAKSYLFMGYGLNFQDKIYQNERIKTCDDKHRRMSLEHLALNYQFFKSKEESEDEVKQRQNAIWKIFDKYYDQLPDKSKETESDKIWRLFLARMDRRKMKPTTEEKEGQVFISFNPEIDPELKKYSEEYIKRSSEPIKYSPLKLWSKYRFERKEDKYKKYQQYESNPQLVITETKEIIEGLKNSKEENFSLVNQSIPAYTCSVLIRDYFEQLDAKEKEFCKEIIIEYATWPLQEYYQYQISDGVNTAVNVLPLLIKPFPQDRGRIKTILLLILFDTYPIGMHQKLSDYSIGAILHHLWKASFEDAHSIFLGYLFLKPKYDDLWDEIKEENYNKNVYQLSMAQVSNSFLKKYKNEIDKIVSNNITYDELSNLDKLDLETLTTAFELLPLKTEYEDHKIFLNLISPVFSKELLINDDRTDNALKHRFLQKFAYFILTSGKEQIETYLKPFLDDFSSSRDIADFFSEFVSAEDILNQYEEFWIVWNAFYTKIVEICKKERSHRYTKEIVYNYLLAWPYRKEDAKEWHTLKDREKLFFKKVSEDIGHHPAVLYSLSKLLNDIGSNFMEDGVFWISSILQKNQTLFTKELEIDTIFYIENIVRRYILNNRQKVKTSKQIKNQILVILNFLLERGSVTGYILREDIL